MTTRIIDDMHPEDLAMLQSLYSRSPASVTEHEQKVRAGGSGDFMDKYYVGYGHASIGDCGTTTIFEEDVSMLVAKAIQDWPLYSGQEASTRYMDFSKSTFSNPAGTSRGHEIQERWRAFYLAAQEPVRAHMRQLYPQKPEEKSTVYDRAISARAFDVLRGFLPAGASTNLSWTTNLRQAADKLECLRCHPHKEVREAAGRILERLKARYRHSFGRELSPERAEYLVRAEDAALLRVSDVPWLTMVENPYAVGFETDMTEVRLFAFSRDARWLLERRPKGALLPRHLAELGQVCVEFALDFGSFRDLQRHRAGVVRMPLLTGELGFHPWYLQQLPQAVRTEALGLIGQQREAIAALGISEVLQQDYFAMGFRVPCRVTQPLPAYIYRLELRSSKAVHPTLRQIVLEEIRQFRERFPNVALHVDNSPDDFTVRRGEQTILERAAEPTGEEIRERVHGAWEKWTGADIQQEIEGARALAQEGEPEPRSVAIVISHGEDEPSRLLRVCADHAEAQAWVQAKVDVEGGWHGPVPSPVKAASSTVVRWEHDDGLREIGIEICPVVERTQQRASEAAGSDGPRSLSGHEPPPRPSDHPAAWDLVLADIRERDEIGEKKYGQRLRPHDGRKNIIDVYQELLDATVYVRKEIYERYGR